MRLLHLSLFGLLLIAVTAQASIFGSLRGIVHDPQHRPVQGAMVMIRAKSSDWAKSANSDANGQFEFNAIPLGEYTVTVANPGFEQSAESVLIKSETEPVLHIQLKVATGNETVTVTAAPEVAPTDSATPTTQIGRAHV